MGDSAAGRGPGHRGRRWEELELRLGLQGAEDRWAVGGLGAKGVEGERRVRARRARDRVSEGRGPRRRGRGIRAAKARDPGAEGEGTRRRGGGRARGAGNPGSEAARPASSGTAP